MSRIQVLRIEPPPCVHAPEKKRFYLLDIGIKSCLFRELLSCHSSKPLFLWKYEKDIGGRGRKKGGVGRVGGGMGRERRGGEGG